MAPRGGYKPKELVLKNYAAKVAGWRGLDTPPADLRPLTSSDLLLLEARLHPTKKRESLVLTEKIVRYLQENRIATVEDICTALGCHDVPVRKRLKALKTANMVRNESRIYHLATPRLDEFTANHLGSVVKWA